MSATNGTHALQQSSSSGSLTVVLQFAAPLSEHSAYVVRAVLGSRLMTHMHQERPSAARGLPKWKRQLNIANLPRNVTAWPQSPRLTRIAKCCEKWLAPGQKSRKRRNKQKRGARL